MKVYQKEGFIMSLKKCNICKEHKVREEFGAAVGNPDGLNYRCKPCHTSVNRKNHDRRKTNLPSRLKTLLSGARKRSNKKGISLEIDLTFLEQLWETQQGRCNITKQELRLDHTDLRINVSQSPSLDQIDPGKGYTKDNVQLVCSWVNSMKSDLTDQELLERTKILTKALEAKNGS